MKLLKMTSRKKKLSPAAANALGDIFNTIILAEVANFSSAIANVSLSC